ncbi:transcription elongation factor A N-terminal and central domain-containing protein isoform X2 [Camelus dromedarius]|nr:transcription elongation factor A N-terminal and central domain-containing protein [Camelus dromedarius]XP_032331675.1 transcription elongation factor A N-terminal and central domain-containing protein [Camelus ferus]
MSDKKQIAARASLIEQLMSKRNFEDLGNPLTELESLCVTKEHLQETEVVRAVYTVLKNCPTVPLKKKAKCLLSKWKALYQDTHCKPRGSPKLFPSGGNPEENQGLSPDLNQDEVRGRSSSNSLQASQDVAEAAAVSVPENSPGGVEPEAARAGAGDPKPADKRAGELPAPAVPVRAKCTELLYEALARFPADPPRADLWRSFAQEIEEHLFTLYSKNLRKYKACVRSKVANLKNPQNTHLRQNLLSGTMSPREFAEMTIMDMASKELKQLRASYTEACIREHSLPQAVEGTQTRNIKCRRCEKFNCKVTVISRGTLFLPSWVRNSQPDEEQMTYVICSECGEQWYHSKWVCL